MTPHLLTDEQLTQFLAQGHLVLKTTHPHEFHEDIYRKTSAVFEKEGNPGNNILPRVPELKQVFEDPVIRGALTSVLGPTYIMHAHRHPHYSAPRNSGQQWHKDSYWGYGKIRHHRPRWVMIFYYPQDVTEKNGPTGILPGTQHYETREDDAPQKLVMGEAGTFALVHFDLWHRGSPNSTDNARYMMKFQFTRMDNPTAPTWNFGGETPTAEKHDTVVRELRGWLSGGAVPFSGNGSASTAEVAAWKTALGSESADERTAAADALGKSGSVAESAIPALTACLSDPSEAVRLNAGYALAAMGEPGVSPLGDALRGESDAARLAAIYGLSVSGASAVPTLKKALEHDSENVRRGAVFALGELGAVSSEAVPMLSRLAEDESVQVRRGVAEALGVLDACPDVAVPTLANILRNDADAQAKFNAALALGRLGEQAGDAVPALADALRDENRYVRGHSVDALARIRTPEAQAVLLDYLEMARWCPSTTKESTF